MTTRYNKSYHAIISIAWISAPKSTTNETHNTHNALFEKWIPKSRPLLPRLGGHLRVTCFWWNVLGSLLLPWAQMTHRGSVLERPSQKSFSCWNKKNFHPTHSIPWFQVKISQTMWNPCIQSWNLSPVLHFFHNVPTIPTRKWPVLGPQLWLPEDIAETPSSGGAETKTLTQPTNSFC